MDFFLGHRVVALAFIAMEIDRFCVFGFPNVSQISKILESWFLMKIWNIFKILRFESLVDVGRKNGKKFGPFLKHLETRKHKIHQFQYQ